MSYTKNITKTLLFTCLTATVILSLFAAQAQAASKVDVTFAVNGLNNYDGVVFTIDGDTYDYWHMPTPKWGVGSTHTVTVTTPITGWDGVGHRFTSWTHGNGLVTASGTFTTPSSDTTVTANFILNTVHVQFEESGITNLDAGQTVLTIDGAPYDFWGVSQTDFQWNIGSTHTVAASTPIVGWDNAVNRFSSWTNGNGLTAATGTYTTPSSDAVITVNYGVTSVNVHFATSGLTNYDNLVYTIDGTQYDFWHLPSFIWESGTTHTVAAATPVTGWDHATHVFSSWTNGNGLTASSGTLTVPSSEVTVTANYGAQGSQATTNLTVTCNPTVVDRTVSNVTTITGQLTSGGAGLGSKTVTLTYYNTTSWIPIATTTTSANGNYIYTWTVPSNIQNGQYAMKADFAGDSGYLASSATTGGIGNGSDMFVLPEYSWGTLTAIIACFAAVLIIKKRNRLHKKQSI
jgi:hypothetical protein